MELPIQHMQFMYVDKLHTDIWFSYFKNYIKVVNHSDDWLNLPFGTKDPSQVTLADFDRALEDRCFERTCAGAKLYLAALNLDCYDSLAIVHKTHGYLYNDWVWIRFDDDPTEMSLEYLKRQFGM